MVHKVEEATPHGCEFGRRAHMRLPRAQEDGGNCCNSRQLQPRGTEQYLGMLTLLALIRRSRVYLLLAVAATFNGRWYESEYRPSRSQISKRVVIPGLYEQDPVSEYQFRTRDGVHIHQ